MASSELLHDFEAKPVLHNLASGGHAVIPLFDMAIAELLHEITAEPVLHNLASTSELFFRAPPSCMPSFLDQSTIAFFRCRGC